MDDSEVLIITKGTVNRVISFLNPLISFPGTSPLFDIHMCLWLAYTPPILVIIWISKLSLISRMLDFFSSYAQKDSAWVGVSFHHFVSE